MPYTYEPIVAPPGFPQQQRVRRSDGAIVPADPANADWQAYQAWLKAGDVPAAAPNPITPVLVASAPVASAPVASAPVASAGG